jgi:predicted component of type VI protein secretion system
MRCSGQSISPYHCMILIEADRVVVRDEASETGTFVNGVRIQPSACLFHGDRLRVGNLEFDVLMSTSDHAEPTVPPGSVPTNRLPNQGDTVVGQLDTIAELVVELLTHEDEADRERRRLDPAAREFRPGNPEPATGSEAAEPAAPPKVKTFVKRPPTKLPPPPPVQGKDTVDAAEQALNVLVTPAAKKKP